MKDFVTVSVIVPIYNVEQYLDTCIKSIVEQTYRNMEILLIDDGSKDLSPDICNQWEKRDSRIRVFQRQNSGVSEARNFGIKNSTGEYLTFVDADDWIESDTVEHALSIALQNASDIVFWPYIRETSSTGQTVHFFPESKVFEGKEIQDILVRKLFGPYGKGVNRPEQMDYCSTVWGKLYRASLIIDNSLAFVDYRKIGMFEDGLFNISAFSKAHRITYLDKNLSHYRRVNTGQLTSTYRPDFYCQSNELYSMMDHLCNELGDAENKRALQNRIAIGMSAQALNITRDDTSLLAKIKKINEILRSARYREAFSELDVSQMPLHWMVFYLFCKNRLGIGVYLMACIMNRLKVKRNG